MDLAHRRLTHDFTFYMFLAEAQIASAVILYACTTFGWFVCFPWGIPQLLQSDWSLSCDRELDYAS